MSALPLKADMFSEGARKRATCWLCRQSAANLSRRSKFPDIRESTGNFINIGPVVYASPLERNRLAVEFPKTENLQQETGNLSCRRASGARTAKA
jgi:hypothetical protein